MSGIYINKRDTIILLSVLLLINPFIACLSSILFLKMGNQHIRVCAFFIAIFIGLLAFTQYSPNGDISRTYHMINSVTDFSLGSFLIYLATDKYLIYTILNVVITNVTGNVQYTSLLWGFLVYYVCFCAIINFMKYFGCDKRKIYFIFLATVFCFIVFAEAMETMKQAVATSMAFLSFSYYLLGRRVKSIIIFILSLGVHFSPLFLLPLFLAKTLKPVYIYVLLLGSFLMRSINLMEISAQIINWLGIFPTLALVADTYSEQNYNNFFSDAPYFQLTFWIVCFIVLLNHIFVKKSNDTIDKAGILFIVMLNLNYSNNHNFTRLLLFSFPVYLMIFMNILCHLKNIITRRILTQFIVFITFFLQFGFSLERFGTDASKYQTSFMDNSLLKITLSPLYFYLDYKVPVN